MDKSALIAHAAYSAALKRTRLRSIEGRRLLPKMPQGGQLRTQTAVALSKNSEEEWVSTVGITVDGYPKDVERGDATPDQRTFTIEIVAQGAYSWAKVPELSVLRDPELARMLGRPLYLLAASEVQALAQKIGFPGVKVAPDIPDSEGSISLTSAEGKRYIAKLTGQSVQSIQDVRAKPARKISKATKKVATKSKGTTKSSPRAKP